MVYIFSISLIRRALALSLLFAMTGEGATRAETGAQTQTASGAQTSAASGAQRAAQPSAATFKHYAEIQARLEIAQKKHSLEEQGDALYDLGVAHYNQRDYGAAESYLRQAISVEDGLKRVGQQIQDRQVLAEILHALKRDNESTTAYNDALSIAQSNQINSKTVDIFLCLGQLALNKNELTAAQTFFNRAQDAAAKGNLPSYQAQALSNLAVVARRTNNNKRAIDYLEQAVKLTTNWEDTGTSFGAIYLQLGTAYADEGMPEKAITAFTAAAKAADEDAEVDLKAKALAHLGDTYLAMQKTSQALDNLRQAESLLAGNQSAAHVDCMISLASAQADLGQFDEAKAGHKTAQTLASQIGYPEGVLLAITELGYDDLLQGSQEKALNGFLAAYDYLCSNLPNKLNDKALLLGYIGMCYDGLGQTQAAVEFAQQSAELFAQLKQPIDQAMAYNGIAVAYLNSGSFTEFKKNFDQAKQLLSSLPSQSVKVKLAQAYLDYNYAQACVCQGHVADAYNSYQSALAAYTEAGDLKGQARVLCGLGLYNLQTDKPKQAIDCYEKAWALAGKQGDVETRWDCGVGLGKAYRKLGNLKGAEERFTDAIQIVETERKQISRDTYKTFNLDWRQDCFEELSDILAASNRADEALEIAEKGRARAFLDLLEVRCRGKLFNGSVTDISDTAERPKLTAMAQASNGEHQRDVSLAPKPRAAVEVSAISPVYAAPPSLSELKSLVQESKSYFVEYYVLPDKILVWVISPDATIKMPPPIVISRAELAGKIKQTYDSIVIPPKSFQELSRADEKRQTNLHELHKLLIAPIEQFLPKDNEATITIVPHGPLFQVPFAALLSRDDKYLAEQHVLAYLPALGVLRATNKLNEGFSGQNKLLAMGNPITKQISFLGALPYAEKEVHAVAALFGSDAVSVEVGNQATKEQFRKLAPNNTFIHLATHGLIDEEHPMDSAVVLAPAGNDDGLLTVRDILQLPPLKARLIVLSACQTGRGKITGDGVVGLSRAFIIAGTPSIVVSQWNVDDVMTEFQMKEFYTAYLKEREKGRALREAQMKTIDFMEKTLPAATAGGEKIRANPRYWAAFQLIGEYK